MENQRENTSREVEIVKQTTYEKDKKIEFLETENTALSEHLSTEKMRLDDIKKELNSVLEKCSALQEEKDLLQRQIEGKSKEIKSLQHNLDEKSEDFETLKTESLKIAKQLESLIEEHSHCGQYSASGDQVRNMEQQIMQLEHCLSMERSSKQAVMEEIEAREQEWEKEKSKLILSRGESSLPKNNNQAEISSLKEQLEELRAKIKEKDIELEEMVKAKESYAGKCRHLESRMQVKVKGLEQQCEDLKYEITHKEEEIFVFAETVKQKEVDICSLERKCEAAKEMELELRHHLGEVTQQLENVQESSSHENEVQRLNKKLADMTQKHEETNEKVNVVNDKGRIFLAAFGSFVIKGSGIL